MVGGGKNNEYRYHVWLKSQARAAVSATGVSHPDRTQVKLGAAAHFHKRAKLNAVTLCAAESKEGSDMIDVGRKYRVIAPPGCASELVYHGIHPHIHGRVVVIEAFDEHPNSHAHFWRAHFDAGGAAGWFTTQELDRVDELEGVPDSVLTAINENTRAVV